MNKGVQSIKSRKLAFEEVIPPKQGRAIEVKQGQHVRVIDVDGKQCGDLAFFNRHNIKEKHCQNLSRSRQFKPGEPYIIKDHFDVGDVIYSTGYRPMMTIVADTAVPGGVHEIELHSCNTDMYKRMGLEPPPNGGCWEILSAVLKPYGITPEDIPDTFDVFANLRHYPAESQWRFEPPVTRPGDYFELLAEMDVIVGLSVCPFTWATNNWVITPLKLEVYDVEYWSATELRDRAS